MDIVVKVIDNFKKMRNQERAGVIGRLFSAVTCIKKAHPINQMSYNIVRRYCKL